MGALTVQFKSYIFLLAPIPTIIPITKNTSAPDISALVISRSEPALVVAEVSPIVSIAETNYTRVTATTAPRLN